MLAAAGVMLAVLVTSASCTGGDGLSNGPLSVVGGDTVVSSKAEPGTTIAYGYNRVTNKGPDSVVNLTAELVPVPGNDYSGVSIGGVMVTEGEAARVGYYGAGPWPDGEFSKIAMPLKGYTVKPDGLQVSLLFVVRVSGKGQWRWPSTRITYETGGVAYSEEVSNGFLICSPATADCDPAPNTP